MLGVALIASLPLGGSWRPPVDYEILVTAALAVACVLVAPMRWEPWSRVGAISLLWLAIAVPRWLGHELAAGHEIRFAALVHHGATTLIVAGLAVALGVAWEGRRVLLMVRERA